MSWASRRRTLYGGGVFLFLALTVGLPTFLWWYEEPTCFDGIQNQGELGIDRGGPCTLLHQSQVKKATVLWTRSFEVVPGVYGAVAYVDNPNFDAGIRNVRYSFKLFDAESLLVAERRGSTYISPNGVTAVFEGAIASGERVPIRAFFEFLEEPQWERVLIGVEGLSIGERRLLNEESAPRLEGEVKNDSFSDIRDVEIIATIFNADNNAIASSRTVVPLLAKQSSAPLVFTWPKPFGTPVAKVEILPRAPFGE